MEPNDLLQLRLQSMQPRMVSGSFADCIAMAVFGEFAGSAAFSVRHCHCCLLSASYSDIVYEKRV
jgi:hypothetical protein